MQLIGIRDVASRIGVSLRKVEQLIAQGEFPPSVRIGRVRRWEESQIDAWIRAHVERAEKAKRSEEGKGRLAGD